MTPAFLLEYKIHSSIFRSIKKFKVRFVSALLLLVSFSASAQLPFNEGQFIARFKTDGALPATILNSRTVVFHPYDLPAKDLESMQKSFQRTGIDAVMYYEADVVWAGRDAAVALAAQLNKREIANLIYVVRDQSGYSLYITSYNQRANLVEQDQPTFLIQHRALDVLLQQLYRTAANTYKKENFLINEQPEGGFVVNGISGQRNEFFAIDLKVDMLAVPKFGDPEMDLALQQMMQLYPYKYALTDPALSESELRKQGYLYVLRFSHARNKIVRNLLGYDVKRSQSAVVSVTYRDTQQQLSNYSMNDMVYKFYFKHIESANVFLGTKWDADPSWQQALLNQLKGFRAELNIN
jgi:hypothetical protein